MFLLNLEAVMHVTDVHNIDPQHVSTNISRPTSLKCFACLVCSQRFYNKHIGEVIDHFDQKHTCKFSLNRLRFECRMCANADLRTEVELDKHIGQVHPNGKTDLVRVRWVCRQCKTSNGFVDKLCSRCKYERPTPTRLASVAPKE